MVRCFCRIQAAMLVGAALAMAGVALAQEAPATAADPKLTLEQVRSHRILLQAIMKEDLAAVRQSLDSGADPNRVIGGYSPLESAALVGNVDIVKLLVERGADPAVKKKDGEPLHVWATKFGNKDPDSSFTQIGAYLKARIDGLPDAPVRQISEEEIADAKLDDGVVIPPEVALKAGRVEKADLSDYNNVPVPAGWTVFRAEKEKAWILSNGQTDAKAVRFILADPQPASESLNLVRQDLERGLSGYAQLCGVPTLRNFDITSGITTYPDKTLSLSANAMGMEQSNVVGLFELSGKIREGKFYAVLLHRGPDDATLPAISQFMDFRQAALKDP